jgi:hypothetical protein
LFARQNFSEGQMNEFFFPKAKAKKMKNEKMKKALAFFSLPLRPLMTK